MFSSHHHDGFNNTHHAAQTDNGDDGFPDRGPAVLAVTTATMALASLFVAARMVSRVGIVRRVGCDDYIMVLAWFIALFLSFSICFGTRRGLGRHDRNIDPQTIAGLRMCEYVFSILYNPALMATKSSVLVFYLRLAKNTQKILRMCSWGLLIIVNLAGIILTFMNIFQCKPISAAWDIHVKAISCIPLLTEFICSAPVNVTTDLAILALPIPVLTSMRLPPRQKMILVLTFSLGIFVTVVDVVRIYYLQQAIAYVPTSASSNPMAMFGQSSGFSWNASLSLMWSAVEVNVGITCACIPTLKPLIIRILPAMLLDPDGSKTMTGEVDIFDSKEAEREEHHHVSPTSAITPGTTLVGGDTSSPPAFVITPPDERPPPVERSSDEISIRDFLSGPGPYGGPSRRASMAPSRRTSFAPSLHRTSTIGGGIHHRDSVATSTAVYFGFVDMKKPKSMIRTSGSESFRYCTIVSILFFLWGFSYGLLNTLNNVVADVADMSDAQTLGLTSVYFGGGYFLGPILVGEWLLRHDEHHRSSRKKRRDSNNSIEPDVGGFKTTFIVGLLIYGTGTIMFWPGAVLAAYGGFMVSSFVVGFGLAVLETAANPFLILCGPPEYADTRLLLAQGVQAVGSVLSGLLANNVFFATIEDRTVDSTTLIDVQWTYLAVTLLSVLLALYFYYMPLPEVTDRELSRLSERLPVDPKKRSLGGVSLRNWTIFFAVLSQWTYVAAQENISIFFNPLITGFVPTPHDKISARPPGFAISTLSYLLVAHTAFAVSRFMAGGITYLSVKYPTNRFLPRPRTILLSSIFLSALFALITTVLPRTSNPNIIAIPLVLFYLAEGPIWPLIFSLGLRGQGARTKRAAAWLTMGASGPAFWPFVSYAIATRSGGIAVNNVQIAVGILVVVLLVVALFYPLLLTAVRDAREMVDWVFVGDTREVLAREKSRGENLGADIEEVLAKRGESLMKDMKLKRRHGRHDEGKGEGGKEKGVLGRIFGGGGVGGMEGGGTGGTGGGGGGGGGERRGTAGSAGSEAPEVEYREGTKPEQQQKRGGERSGGGGREEVEGKGARLEPWDSEPAPWEPGNENFPKLDMRILQD
ncbi:major facilitator superfamily domain-containing protein [Podospora australis]|uniref:Major facilitator superfamily domain-containing protein n=1 Tax=Podospora australis TaxID=1536484 RepID=A0AAN6WZY8_9PEZI|nr:major facilitator superfamily domain-containing protein [Podospora australis]